MQCLNLNRPLAADKQVLEVKARIQEQKARLQRMIAQGTIAQSDDDFLREMYLSLKQMQAARPFARRNPITVVTGRPAEGRRLHPATQVSA